MCSSDLVMENLTATQLQECVASWIFCRDYEFLGEGNIRRQKEEAVHFIQGLAPRLEELQKEDLDQILKKISPRQNSPAGSWENIGYLTYRKGPWEMNLLSGQAFYNGSSLEKEGDRNLKQNEWYMNLFEELKVSQIKVGDTQEFKDPVKIGRAHV